jgi:Protein of unknown function (DUF2946)
MIAAISLRGRRVFKTMALWLGLAALMVQGLAPLCASVGGAGGTIASVVICTAHGFETVQVGADGKPLPQHPSKSMSDCCSACHAPGGFTVTSPIPVAGPSSIAYGGALIVPAPVVTARFYSSYVTRGPPAATSHELA